MFSIVKKLFLLIMSLPLTWGYCLLLKNQESSVRKVIVDNDYMTFPFKIGIDRCTGSCNSENNPYYKICLPNSIKNISAKSLDLISQRLVFKNISFHKTCKCGCLLDEKVCNNLQKWTGKKCRCECLTIKKCNTGYSWNVNNGRCEMKKLARLIQIEECDIETDEVPENKTIKCKTFPTLIKKVKDCKPFIAVSILFLCISIILIGIMTYFCLTLCLTLLMFYPFKTLYNL